MTGGTWLKTCSVLLLAAVVLSPSEASAAPPAAEATPPPTTTPEGGFAGMAGIEVALASHIGDYVVAKAEHEWFGGVVAARIERERVAAEVAAETQRKAEAAAKQAPAPSQPAAPSAPSGGGGKWEIIAQCESGGNWSISTGTFEGGLQFFPQTWAAYGGGQYAAHAYQATKAQQIAIAEKVLAAQGWSAWPVCSRKAGYR